MEEKLLIQRILCRRVDPFFGRAQTSSQEEESKRYLEEELLMSSNPIFHNKVDNWKIEVGVGVIGFVDFLCNNI